MEWPPPLQRGDRIALVAPARAISPELIAPFQAFAESQGWKVVYEPAVLFAQAGRFAGPDALRQKALQEALDAPEIRAIWCVRGGHGSTRLWPFLNWEKFRQFPKWLIGFSDITPLLWAAAYAGVVALHAPLASLVPHRVDPDALAQLLAILQGSQIEYSISWSRLPMQPWRPGCARGLLLGGNLSLLQTLCGTSLDLANWPEPPILFWEEVGEYLYRLDRMTWHLRNATWYARSVALLIGDMRELLDEEDAPLGQTPQEIILSALPDGLVCAGGLPVGHGRLNYPLPIGAWSQVEITETRAVLRVWRSD
ncbi:MAG: LD-carboxypeptidase [Bacteroidia bacterium]